MSESGSRSVLDVLEPVLSDRSARKRRLAILARSEGVLGAHAQELSDLDEVLELLRERVGHLRREADLPGGLDAHERALLESAAASKVDPTTTPPFAESEGIVVDDSFPSSEEAAEEELLADAPTRLGERRPSKARGDLRRRQAELLYEDVLWLFSINDGEGALISLERLLMLGELDGEASEFVKLNSDKLLHLYEGYIGPFTKIPVRGDVPMDSMPPAYLEMPSLGALFSLVDGERTLQEIMDTSKVTPLVTCAALEQLNRSRIIQI